MLFALLAIASLGVGSASLQHAQASSFRHPFGAAAGAFPSRATSAKADGEVIPNHYIVVLQDSVAHPAALAGRQINEQDGSLGLVYRHALKGYSAELDKSAVEDLRENPQVKYVVPDRVVGAQAQTSPSGVVEAHAIENSSLLINKTEDLDVDADVALIDSGIDYQNPDLDVVARTNCVPSGENFLTETAYSECKDNTGVDLNGHGTHVAGTVAALDNGEGVVGVAPGARLWAVRVMNREGGGAESWIAAGVDWVTAHASQIEVANMSLGCACSMPVVEEAIDASTEAGVVYTVAAGNRAIDVKEFSPAKNPNVITVSAMAVDDSNSDGLKPSKCSGGTAGTLASFSDYGKGVDVTAPGTCIYSTLPNGDYGYLAGTSMAAPHVAGAAAILASMNNPDDLADVENIREEIENAGSSNWTDTSGDGAQEPLLDVASTSPFDAQGPAAVTRRATIQSSSKATLKGVVNPGGTETKYHFEYGTTTSYGTNVPSPEKGIGSGNKYVEAAAALEGLRGQTLYHYRVVGVNSKGTFYGADRTFGTTPPVATIEAPNVTANDATLRASVKPEGLESTYQFEYGTTTSYEFETPSSPKAIGASTGSVKIEESIGFLTGGKTYHYRLTLRNAAGTTYGEDHTLTTPASEWQTQVPAETGQPMHGLRDVSCVSATDCTAVGWFWNISASEQGPLAEHWNGKDWSLQSIPYPAGKSHATESSGISCSSASWCVAVGTYLEAGNPYLFVEQWDGSKWSVGTISKVEVGNFEHLPHVSCASASACVLVATGIASGAHALAGIWDGKEWKVQSLPEPAGTSQTILSTVSCPSATSCVAVGLHRDGSGKFLNRNGPLAEHWDGKVWTIIQNDDPGLVKANTSALYGVSCGASNSCVATFSGGLQAEHWNGESWTLESVPEPLGIEPEAEKVGNAGVSCPAVDWCRIGGWYSGAVSYYLNTGVKVAPRTAAWNGSSWSSRSAANPGHEEEPTGAWSYLEGISCVSSSTCVGVGARGMGASGASAQLIERYENPGPISETGSATGVHTTTATLNATINPKGFATSYYFEYGKTTSYGTKIPTSAASAGSGTSDVAVSQTPSSLAEGTTYHYRVVAESAAGTTKGADKTFTTQKLPTVANESPTGVKAGAATLHAAVNAEGLSTTYQFEYGKTTSYGSKAPASPWNIGVGTGDVKVSETLSGLEKGATYHYRVVAANAAGTVNGADQSVAIPSHAAAETGAVTDTTATAARLHGLVFPVGVATTYRFDYGETSSYGSSSAAVSAGSGTADVAVGAAIGGLKPGTTYHYRLTASDSGGESQGGDKTFTTAPARWFLDGTEVTEAREAVEVTGLGKLTFQVTTALTVTCEVTALEGRIWNGKEGMAPEGGLGLHLAPYCYLTSLGCTSEAAKTEGSGSIEVLGQGGEEARFSGFWVKLREMPTKCTGNSTLTISGELTPRWSDSEHAFIFSSTPGLKAAGLPTTTTGKLTMKGAAGGSIAETAPPPFEGTSVEDVSCASSTNCTAVGAYVDATGRERALIRHWDGSSWKAPTTLWEPTRADATRLTGVSCDATRCVAVGYSTTGSKTRAISTFNESGYWWEQGLSAAPAWAWSRLEDVSCGGSLFSCTMVGAYSESPDGSHPRALAWKMAEVGEEAWEEQERIPSHPEGADAVVLTSVSCPGAECFAVGYLRSGSSTEAVGLREAGSEAWSTPEWWATSYGAWSRLQDISCSAELRCTAVGSSSAYASGEQPRPLAESFGEVEEEMVESRELGWEPSGADAARLTGVGCTGSVCRAVGYSLDGSHTEAIAEQSENGGPWSQIGLPILSWSRLESISCPSGSGFCAAVGSRSKSAGGEQLEGLTINIREVEEELEVEEGATIK
jgi:subtilisin family serine protease